VPQNAPDPKRNTSSTHEALRLLGRKRAMIERATRPAIPDPLENHRKIIARGAAPHLANPAVRSIASPRLNLLESFIKQQNAGADMASLVTKHAAIPDLAWVAKQRVNQALPSITSRTSLLESFAKLQPPSPAASAAAKLQTSHTLAGLLARRRAEAVQTGGLASILSQQKASLGIAELGKAQTGGLAAHLAKTHRISRTIAALGKAQTGGLAAALSKQNGVDVAGAIESMRKATDTYAFATRALEPPRGLRRSLTEAARAFDAESTAEEVALREPILSMPVMPNYSADLVVLEREAAEQRKQDRREELEHRRQSLAVQHSMRDALIASEEARAADAKASAKREQAALARADAAEAREIASAAAQAKQTRFLIKWTVATGVFGAVGSIAAVVTIAGA
jgi:hypothetical protein